jgi:chromosome segregation ATPase
VSSWLETLIWSSISGNPALSQTTADLDARGTRALVDVAVSGKVLERMRAVDAGSSWFTEAVRQQVVAQRAHVLAQNAGAAEQRLAQASSQVETTRDELSARQATLQDIERRLADKPSDPDLKQQQQQLQQEVRELTEAWERAARDQQSAGDELRETREAQRESEQEGREIDTDLGRRGGEVFHGE